MRLHSLAQVIPRRAFLCATALATVLPFVGISLANESVGSALGGHGQTVALVIDYNNGVKKLYTKIPWAKGMTVLDAMNQAKASRPGITFSHRGSGSTVFLTEIDGFANEGAGKDKNNWLYWVNDSLGQKSVGVNELNIGDVIIWRYDRWAMGDG